MKYVEGRALEKMSTLEAWENSKKATIEMEFKKIEVITYF
ncbi:hypothetical protein C5167_022859, partial [Papaver somniferum]